MGLIPAMVFWGITLYLFRPSVMRRVEWPESYIARLFTFCLAVGLTVMTEPLAQLLDYATINNLSWLLGYALSALGSYFGLYAWAIVHKLSMRRGTLILLTTLLVLTLLFPALAMDREIPHDGSIGSRTHLVFCTTMYLFLAFMSLEVLPMLRRLLKDEHSATGQLRLMSGILGVECGLVFALIRSLLMIGTFVDPAWGMANIVKQITTTLMALCAIGLVGAATPYRFLLPLAWVRSYLQQQRALYRLQKLRRTLGRLTSPLPWPGPSWHEQIFQPSYALYCCVIDILDRRSILVQTRADYRETIVTDVIWLFEPLPETDWLGTLDHFRRHLKI